MTPAQRHALFTFYPGKETTTAESGSSYALLAALKRLGLLWTDLHPRVGRMVWGLTPLGEDTWGGGR